MQNVNVTRMEAEAIATATLAQIQSSRREIKLVGITDATLAQTLLEFCERELCGMLSETMKTLLTQEYALLQAGL